MAFGSLALLPLMLLSNKYKGEHKKTIKKNWKAFIFIGCVNGPQIALNNASLVKIELSLNQVPPSTPLHPLLLATLLTSHLLPPPSEPSQLAYR